MTEIAELPTRAQILRLESEMRGHEQPDIPTTHSFAPGLYVRTINVPAGVTIVGKAHATEHIFLLSKGRMTIVSEYGRATIEAPYQCVSPPGSKRVGYAHTDCVCTNVHITDETDLVALEAQLITPEALAAPEQSQEIEACHG